jgi:hypothetical protein
VSNGTGPERERKRERESETEGEKLIQCSECKWGRKNSEERRRKAASALQGVVAGVAVGGEFASRSLITRGISQDRMRYEIPDSQTKLKVL